MTYLDAAHTVLQKTGQPLHYKEITEQALEHKLIAPQGMTPAATMGSRLYVDTNRPGSRFRRAGRGIFALAEPQLGSIAQQITALNRRTRTELRKRLSQMPADRFEALVGELLIALGFDESTVEVTRHSGDGGIDVRGVLRAGGITEVKAAVQVKRWKRNVQARTVRDLRGSLTVHEQGIIITTSDFSSGARNEAEEVGKTRISLVNCEELLDLLVEHGIGISQEQHTLLSLDDEWWGELTGETVAIVQPSAPLPKPSASAVGYPLPVQSVIRGQTFEGKLLDARGRMRYDGKEYRSPSGAGQAATGWKSCNGWHFWRHQDSETGEWRVIAELRSQ